MASVLERVLRRDRLVLGALLALLTAISWIVMARMAGETAGVDRVLPCCASIGLMCWMWIVMMAGMMVPSVTPMVLTHAAVMRRRVKLGAPYISSLLFLAGYLAVWSGFSVVAAAAQWILRSAAVLDAQRVSLHPLAGCGVLLAAGAFQLSAVKEKCLSECRAPLGYFLTDWREGRLGAFVMGARHGWSCLGCCWLLMAILFAAGVMSLWWSAALTAFVVLEKLIPWPRVAVWSGALLCFGGAIALLVRAVL